MSYQQPMHRPPFPPPPAPPKAKVWPWILAVIGAFVVGAVVGTAAGTDSGGSSAQQTVTIRVPAPDSEPESAAQQQAGPIATVGSGTYQVGVDVQPGQYKTAGPESDDSLGCYWARLKDDSGSVESIIANANLDGPGSVTVNQGEFVELNGDCTWTKVG